MTAREVPQEWAELLTKAGLTDPRNGTRASMTQLAEAAGIHASTVSDTMYGVRQTNAETANKIAIAISDRLPGLDRHKTRRRVLRLINESFGSASPFVPHPDADLLDSSEQRLVNELIGLLARSKRRRPGDAEQQLYIVDEKKDPLNTDDREAFDQLEVVEQQRTARGERTAKKAARVAAPKGEKNQGQA